MKIFDFLLSFVTPQLSQELQKTEKLKEEYTVSPEVEAIVNNIKTYPEKWNVSFKSIFRNDGAIHIECHQYCDMELAACINDVPANPLETRIIWDTKSWLHENKDRFTLQRSKLKLGEAIARL